MTDIARLPHDFDGLQAKGDWVIAEDMGPIEMTRGGLVVPEVSRIPKWIVISVGPKCDTVCEGERIIVMPSQNPIVLQYDGRTFAFLHPQQIIGTLPQSVQTALVRPAPAFALQ